MPPTVPQHTLACSHLAHGMPWATSLFKVARSNGVPRAPSVPIPHANSHERAHTHRRHIDCEYPPGCDVAVLLGRYRTTSAEGRTPRPTPVCTHQIARAAQGCMAHVQMMLHHAVDDPFVQYGGCCRSRQCCCAICSDCSVCVSTDSYFSSWAENVGVSFPTVGLHCPPPATAEMHARAGQPMRRHPCGAGRVV
jgi:hypothetical protein